MSFFLLWTLTQWCIRIVHESSSILRRRFLPATALAWLGMIFLVPEIGLVFYLLIGSNRLGRKRIRRHHEVVISRRTDDRLASRIPHVTRPEMGPLYGRVVTQAERITGMPILGGNAVELLSDYTLAINHLIADIDAAKNHVHLLYYIFSPDATGQRVADALIRAAGRGVKCRVLADAAASRYLFGSRGLAGKLNAQGVETYPALPVARFRTKLARIDLRNHRKLAVIDCSVAYAGSQNLIDADYDYPGCPPTIDLVGRFRGPVVAQLQGVFLEDWEFDTDQELTGEDVLPAMQPAGPGYAQVVATGPSVESEALPRVILSALNVAQQRIITFSPPPLPGPRRAHALCPDHGGGARRGCDDCDAPIQRPCPGLGGGPVLLRHAAGIRGQHLSPQ